MRGALAVAMVLAINAPAAATQLIILPLNETARSSDLIVAGRLTNIRGVQAADSLPMPETRRAYYEGTILVLREIWPDTAAAHEVTLRWSLVPPVRNGSEVTVIAGWDDDDSRLEGKCALWLLRSDGKDGFVSIGPYRTILLETDASVRSARLDLIVREKYLSLPEGTKEPWKLDPRLERLKVYFDEILAGFEAEFRRDRGHAVTGCTLGSIQK